MARKQVEEGMDVSGNNLEVGPHHARGAVPMYPRVMIHQDATDLVDQCVKDFMGIFAMETHEERRKENQTKMSGLQVTKAMDKLGFNNYVGPSLGTHTPLS